MATTSPEVSEGALKAHHRAQAQLKFACQKCKQLVGGQSKLADVSVEDWDRGNKAWEKVSELLAEGSVEGEVLWSFEMPDLISRTRTEVTEFLNGLDDALDGINDDAKAQFQVIQKMALARRCLRAVERASAGADVAFEKEKGARKDWEVKNPRLAEQERELGIYSTTLRGLLLRDDSLNRLEKGEWIQAEGCLKSLELYLFENKIEAERVRVAGLEELMRGLLERFEKFDEEGIDVKRADVDRAGRVWGLVDKLGSGLMWLMRNDKMAKAGEAKPTTRSTFLLKSAPPAKMTFCMTKQEWQEKELIRARDRIKEILLDDDKPIARDQENRWNAAYKELEALQAFIKKHKVQGSSIQKAKLGATMRDVERRLGALHEERADGKDVGIGEHELMYMTWECAMRLSTEFEELGDK